MPKLKDITGQRFGRLVVVARANNNYQGDAMWHCRCDCGNEHIARGSNLRRGEPKSCGCLQRDTVTFHGHRKTSNTASAEWYSWRGMRERCQNPRCKDYENYGGRGIVVCERWQVFTNFLADMGPRPQGHSIDRIDNNGNYEPGNCRGATASQQRINQRPLRKRDHRGRYI